MRERRTRLAFSHLSRRAVAKKRRFERPLPRRGRYSAVQVQVQRIVCLSFLCSSQAVCVARPGADPSSNLDGSLGSSIGGSLGRSAGLSASRVLSGSLGGSVGRSFHNSASAQQLKQLKKEAKDQSKTIAAM